MEPDKSETDTVRVAGSVLNSSTYFSCELLTVIYSNWRFSYC